MLVIAVILNLTSKVAKMSRIVGQFSILKQTTTKQIQTVNILPTKKIYIKKISPHITNRFLKTQIKTEKHDMWFNYLTCSACASSFMLVTAFCNVSKG